MDKSRVPRIMLPSRFSITEILFSDKYSSLSSVSLLRFSILVKLLFCMLNIFKRTNASKFCILSTLFFPRYNSVRLVSCSIFSIVCEFKYINGNNYLWSKLKHLYVEIVIFGKLIFNTSILRQITKINSNKIDQIILFLKNLFNINILKINLISYVYII